MLYVLWFSTCLASNPAHCILRQHHFNEDIATPQQCLAVAQPQLAVWQQSHTEWRVERFRCGKPPRDPGTVI